MDNRRRWNIFPTVARCRLVCEILAVAADDGLMCREHPQRRCVHGAHLRDLGETLPLPSVLYSRLNLLLSGRLPGKRRNQFALLHPVSWQPDTLHHLIHYSGLSIKALATIILEANKEPLQSLFTLSWAECFSECSTFTCVESYSLASRLHREIRFCPACFLLR